DSSRRDYASAYPNAKMVSAQYIALPSESKASWKFSRYDASGHGDGAVSELDASLPLERIRNHGWYNAGPRADWLANQSQAFVSLGDLLQAYHAISPGSAEPNITL